MVQDGITIKDYNHICQTISNQGSMNIYNFFKGNPKNLPQNHPMLAFHHPPPLLNSKLQEGTAQVPLHELGADHRQTPILRTHPKKNTLLVNEKCASKFPKKTKKNSQIPYHPTKKKICIYIYIPPTNSHQLFPKKNPFQRRFSSVFSKKTSRFPGSQQETKGKGHTPPP